MRCHHILTIGIVTHILPEMTQAGKMVTCGSIMVHTSQERLDIVNIGPYHLSIEYGKEHETPLQQGGATIFLRLSYASIVYLK